MDHSDGVFTHKCDRKLFIRTGTDYSDAVVSFVMGEQITLFTSAASSI